MDEAPATYCAPRYAARMLAFAHACTVALTSISLASISSLLSPSNDTSTLGYYRMPAIHGETIVFVSEGDLWRGPTGGGLATRLTTHPGEELQPSISPDGSTLAFTASYEGPR